MHAPGDSLSAQDIEALEQPAVVEDVAAVDIDIDQWLGEQAAAGKRTSYAVIDGKRIPIAVVSEGEENRLIRQSRRPDPRNPRDLKLDMLVFRRVYVAFSLSKATGRQVLPEQLEAMPPGTLTRLQNEIQRLSQYDVPERPQQDPLSLSV